MPYNESNKPNWPVKPDYTSPKPNSSTNTIPPRKQIHSNGPTQPHSPSPRPLGGVKK